MSVYAIYFSPTRSTEKIVKILAKEFGNYGEIDLSKQSSGENVRAFKEKWDDWISCFHTTLVCENRSSFLLN